MERVDIAMVSHYLLFDRNCAQAVEVYKEALDATVLEMQKYGDMPPDPNFPITEADRELVLHARLQLSDGEIMCADSSGSLTAGDNMYVSIMTRDEAAVRRAWDVLKEGGDVDMELAPSFFALLHGSLQDRFGTR